MAYVITQNCCKDTSCVTVCPVDCIRPDQDAPSSNLRMLYIDPDTCVDCGACEVECPVDAIYYEDDLPPQMERYRDINADYFQRHPLDARSSAGFRQGGRVEPGALRVAVVGAGPAACYAIGELLEIDGTEVDVYERLPAPFGLIRTGVAPDHQRTKSIADMFGETLSNPRVRCHFNVEVGQDISHDEVMTHHHAVIYGVGAPCSRSLGVSGEELMGSVPAADFVAWYNGHPDQAEAFFDLTGERAVLVGNGNVALDIARVLLVGREALQDTDITECALDALEASTITEVVIIGRRDPRHAAFSAAELLALGHLPDIDVVIDGDCPEPDPADDAETSLKLALVREFAQRPASGGNKRIVFRFMASPIEIVGTDRVEAVHIVRNTFSETHGLVAEDNGEIEVIKTGLVMRSIGFMSSPIEGLPFDHFEGRIPNQRGRVTHPQCTSPHGVYVTGWIKRGPRGVIGTNRSCARETVAALWEDFGAGRLTKALPEQNAIAELLKARGGQQIDWDGWCSIDAAERETGVRNGRPRVKFIRVDEMLRVATEKRASDD